MHSCSVVIFTLCPLRSTAARRSWNSDITSCPSQRKDVSRIVQSFENSPFTTSLPNICRIKIHELNMKLSDLCRCSGSVECDNFCNGKRQARLFSLFRTETPNGNMVVCQLPQSSAKRLHGGTHVTTLQM